MKLSAFSDVGSARIENLRTQIVNPRFFSLIAISLMATYHLQAQVPGQPQPPPSQTPGFLDLAWGSSAELIKKQFAQRAHARFDKAASSNEELCFQGGKFAGLKAAQFFLHLASDRMWKADVVFEPVSKDHKKEFAILRQLLIEKYGPPTSESNRGQDQVVEWYLSGLPGVDKDKICLDTELRGSGMKLFYAADRIAKVAVAPGAPPVAGDPASKSKPGPVAPKVKDDL